MNEPERKASRRERGLSRTRRVSILIGAFLLALSITLSGCNSADKEEQKKEAEKKEEQDKEKKEGTQ
jgi:hypothetical protein